MQPTSEFEPAKLNLFQAIVEQAPDAIIFADRDGAIRVWNHGAETIFGYAAAKFWARVRCDHSGTTPTRALEGFHRAIDTGQPYGNRVLTTPRFIRTGANVRGLSFGLVRDEAGAVWRDGGRPDGPPAIFR